MKRLWKKKFSVQLQNCDANNVIIKKLSKISEEGVEDDSRYDRDVQHFSLDDDFMCIDNQVTDCHYYLEIIKNGCPPNCSLGHTNLILCCASPTDSYFRDSKKTCDVKSTRASTHGKWLLSLYGSGCLVAGAVKWSYPWLFGIFDIWSAARAGRIAS